MKKCVIAIPVYKMFPEKYEITSFLQCEKILCGCDIKFVCPESLDVTEYNKLGSFDFVRMSDDCFHSILSYSKMLLEPEFYKKFEDYEYMLIYQLDAWVFEDKLQYWCEQGYDYIGAPWFEKFNTTDPKSKMQKYAGNGGFSLRNIRTFIEVLSDAHNSDKKMKSFLQIYTKEGHSSVFNIFRLPKALKIYFSSANKLKNALKKANDCEDNIIVNYLRLIYPQLKISPSQKAKYFSFETFPERLFKECGEKLPFGCHAFKKYNQDFWKNYIKLEE